ncbi:hypothetical protein CPB84DRAFT_1676981 [Gymnopilus junonius]|uniref:Uncharacterized protein n=1 Tax=Gymnopilus junonius TaxID=109634 RepID=A0A9P5TP98_GYMJU|nr:hypothetical protein CPB84DRAFT_1676981 [Gymnopilus junonius]
MPDNTSSQDFKYTGSGTNSQGNHWCSRQTDSGDTGYHYSNKDDSYYYKNPDRSTYFENGKGDAKYTSPSGQTKIYKK